MSMSKNSANRRCPPELELLFETSFSEDDGVLAIARAPNGRTAKKMHTYDFVLAPRARPTPTFETKYAIAPMSNLL